MTTSTQLRLLRLPQVIELTGLGRDSIYRLIREGRFPTQRRITDRASAWRLDEVAAWIESRPKPGQTSSNSDRTPRSLVGSKGKRQ